ncbi:hypothetical protein, partial [Pseudomonas marginalis]|uniref:hypothetical protein n=1 Tax=Pseudomonas marginalis TaxID=298 RepID=UPI002B1CCAA2
MSYRTFVMKASFWIVRGAIFLEAALAALELSGVVPGVLGWKCGRGGATIRLAPDGGLWADLFFGLDRVHIRCCGNGHLGFRSYSGSLLEERQ